MTALLDRIVPRTGGGLSPAVVRAIALVSVLAVAAAVWFGISWFRAANDDSLALANARDVVLLDAQQAAINLNTLDYQRVEEGLDLWEQSSTGEVKAALQSSRSQYVQVIKEAKRKTVAKAVDAAVVELDQRAGTARVLVGIDVTVTPDKGDSTLTRMRLQLAMSRTDQGWKVASIGPVGSPSAETLPR